MNEVKFAVMLPALVSNSCSLTLTTEEFEPTLAGDGAAGDAAAGDAAASQAFLDMESDDEEEYLVADAGDGNELDRYLALPVAAKGTDALAWWKAHERVFPNLSKMARQFLGSPASTAAIERLFSHCSNMHSDLRKQLKDDTFTDAMFARNAD